MVSHYTKGFNVTQSFWNSRAQERPLPKNPLYIKFQVDMFHPQKIVNYGITNIATYKRKLKKKLV